MFLDCPWNSTNCSPSSQYFPHSLLFLIPTPLHLWNLVNFPLRREFLCSYLSLLWYSATLVFLVGVQICGASLKNNVVVSYKRPRYTTPRHIPGLSILQKEHSLNYIHISFNNNSYTLEMTSMYLKWKMGLKKGSSFAQKSIIHLLRLHHLVGKTKQNNSKNKNQTERTRK